MTTLYSNKNFILNYGKTYGLQVHSGLVLDDNNSSSFVGSRKISPFGLKNASSEIFNVRSIQKSGFQVVSWTVNEPNRMKELMNRVTHIVLK